MGTIDSLLRWLDPLSNIERCGCPGCSWGRFELAKLRQRESEEDFQHRAQKAGRALGYEWHGSDVETAMALENWYDEFERREKS